MTTYYVDGTNGSDAYNGTAATFTSGSTGPKKTLSGAEAIPVAAGDVVYVRSGTYRETLTCGVSGTAGNPITYQGDYTGAIWAGGGVVRITGSDNDQTATRVNGIVASSKNYRTFTGLQIDTTSSGALIQVTSSTNWILRKLYLTFPGSNADCIKFVDSCTNNLVQNCYSRAGMVGYTTNVAFRGSSAVDNTANTVSDCIFVGGYRSITNLRVGDVTIKNCIILDPGLNAVAYEVTPNAGQTMTVNNCIISGCDTALSGGSVGFLVEDYNDFFGNRTTRSNVGVGANSKTYPPLFDTRWFFQLVTAASANQVVTPFDLSSASQLINLAGTSPTATDMRGTAAIGGTREWGALEYDSGLKTQGGGGGAVSISPLRGRLGG